MASNKTPNLGLDVWAETDYFKRAELNNNFKKLDDEVEVLSSNFTTQLSDKPDKSEVRLRVEKINQTDVTEEFLQQMAGTTPINSIPANKSVTPERTAFLSTGEQLFNKKNIIVGKTIRTSDGAVINSVATDFVSDYIPVENGKSYYLYSYSSAYKDYVQNSLVYVSYGSSKNKLNYGTIATGSLFTAVSDGYIQFKQTTNNVDALVFIQANDLTNIPKMYKDFYYTINGLKVAYLDETVSVANSKLTSLQTDVNNLKSETPLNYVPFKKDYYQFNKTLATITPSSTTSSLTGKLHRSYENSTKKDIFRYSCGISDMAIDSSYLYQKDNLPYWVEFMFDGLSFEIASHSNGASFQVITDDVVVTEKVSVASTGGLLYTGVTFPERKTRKIRICFRGSFRFHGVKCDIQASVYPFLQRRPFSVFDGDSITEGTGSNQVFVDGYVGVVSKILDWDVTDLAYGGTGFVNPGAGGRVPIGQRLDNVASKNPDIFVVCCGLNDAATTDYFNQAQAAITKYFADVKTKLPNSEVIVLSPFSPNENGNVTNLPTVAGWVKSSALANNFYYIDIIYGETIDKFGNSLASGWGGVITGTGKEGSPTGDGNRDFYITSDGTHPTPSGHQYLGRRIAEEIYRIYNS